MATLPSKTARYWPPRPAWGWVGLAATIFIGHRWRSALWHRLAAANAHL